MSKKDESILRKEIVKAMVLMYHKNFVTPMGGNVSARLQGSDDFWITPSGLFKGELKVQDLVNVTLNGEVLSGRRKPSVETPLHSKIYRIRSDVCAVVHAHSPFTLGTALAGVEIKPITPESYLFVGKVPVAQFETPGTEDLANRVVEMLKSNPVAVMQNHGVLATGKNILEALNRIEVVELTAQIMTIAHVWGKAPTLSASQIEKLKRMLTA